MTESVDPPNVLRGIIGSQIQVRQLLRRHGYPGSPDNRTYDGLYSDFQPQRVIIVQTVAFPLVA